MSDTQTAKNLASEHLKDLLYLGNDGSVCIEFAANGGGLEHNVYFITADGGALAIDTVIAEIGQVDFTDSSDPQWFITGYQVNYEDAELVDDHTGKPIPSAYGDDD